ncbi:hypothetical protein V6N11_076713 [Hibiscus sabdariffa]|uniref:Uncharacterized protein n=1 Tax=Hibiscus sabdariffa TaxID=183260 RepID=A0ABR2NCE8_9ROSI
MQDPNAVQGHSSPRLYEIASSRPPDGIPQVSRFPPLERLASPTLLEQQRSAKKAKGNSEIDSGHDSMTIDDDQSVGPTVVETDMNQQTEGNQDGEKSTYVGKVMANGSVGIGGNGPTGFREDDVTILEDEIILDHNSPIPSIQFSNRVHDQIDHNLRNALIVRLLGRTIGYNVMLSRIHALLKPDCCPLSKKKDEVAIEAGIDKQPDVLISESNLYGPWMVVDNRRRRTFNSTRGDTLGASKSKPQSGSRFEVLDVDDGSDQQHNEDVVIMGNLTAQEKELQGGDDFTASGTMSIESKSMGRAGKLNMEGANKGFKVKKLMDSKVARSNVVEWVKSAHARIDQHTVSVIMVGDGSSERNLAMDGIPRAPTVVEVEHNPYIEVMSDNGDRMMDSLGGDQ